MFFFKLEDTLKELGITKNKLSVESKVRSNTIIDLANGNVGRIDLYSLQSILDTLNKLAMQKGLLRNYNINDIITYDYFTGTGKYFTKEEEFESDEHKQEYLRLLAEERSRELKVYQLQIEARKALLNKFQPE